MNSIKLLSYDKKNSSLILILKVTSLEQEQGSFTNLEQNLKGDLILLHCWTTDTTWERRI
jgi:sialic acid synthase SpsE